MAPSAHAFNPAFRRLSAAACRGFNDIESATRISTPRFLAPLLIACLWGCGGPSDPPSGSATGTAQAPSTPPAATASPWFEDATQAVGVNVRHTSGFDGSFFMPEIMAPGVAVFDADGDGRLDILAVNGVPHAATEANATAARPVGDRLLLQSPDGQFVDATEASGLGSGYGMGIAVGDIDNDGDRDVYITRYGLDGLYRNRGDGTFDDITAAAGIEVDGWSTSAGFFDYDLDGLLDLYVVRYVEYDSARRCSLMTGQPDYCGPLSFRGQQDVLLRGLGNGRFKDVSEQVGLRRQTGRGLGLALTDVNGDGWVDAYVANDGEANHLWVQTGDGRFMEQAVVSGVAVNLLGRREASMGVTMGDADGDGQEDVFLTHLGQETNTLYLASGAAGTAPSGSFEDRVAGSGLGRSSLPYTGFGTSFFDGDLDGDLDLLVANGKVRLLGDQPAPEDDDTHPLRRYDEPDILYINGGRGDFTLHSAAGPLRQPFISRGLVTADWDDDGDLDTVIATVDGPLRLLRNVALRRGRYLHVEAIDDDLQRAAIGARVWLEAGSRRWVRTVQRTTSYASSQPATVHFGLGDGDGDVTLRVRWPGGAMETFPVPGLDRRITVRRGTGNPTTAGTP